MTQRSNRERKAGELPAWLRSVFLKSKSKVEASRPMRKLPRIHEVLAKTGRGPAQES